MKVYRYRLIDGYLVPDNNGDIKVYLENNFILITNENGNELKNVKFKYLGNESVLLNKLKYIAEKANIVIDENSLLAYPTLKERILAINKMLGKVFEEYIYNLLTKKNYKVERQREIYSSLHNFTLDTYHNRPDFIVENKIVIEAKVSKNDYNQTLEYSKYFKNGMVVFPFSGECRVPKGWVCVSNTINDFSRFYSTLEDLLSRSK
ncbi:MAG: GxxExxY protein [Sulfolobaceae archaeon]